jgi:excisionase family DNA binding protein
MELLLTPEEAARLLGLSPFTVRRLLRQGELPGRKVGKRQWRIRRADLEEYLRAPRRTHPSGVPPEAGPQPAGSGRLERLATEQGVQPIADFDRLLALGEAQAGGDEEFLAAVRELREISPAGVQHDAVLRG